MSSFIADLKGRLPQSDWPTVVAALRNEPTLWAALQEGDFSAQALEAAGEQRTRWSPAFLGLLRIGQVNEFDSLSAEPLQPVNEKLRYQAASAYEQLATETSANNTPTLEQATLIALALRERRRLLNSWEQLVEDPSIAQPEFWKLPVAILFGILPNPQELLETLLDEKQPEAIQELGLHALVTNPLNLDEQATKLTEIIANFALPNFLSLLQNLARIHAPLAQQAAQNALTGLEEKESSKYPVGGGVGTRHDLSEIDHLLLQAEIKQISGHQAAASTLLRQAWDASQRVQSELVAKMAETQGEDIEFVAVKQQAALIESKSLNPITPTPRKNPAALLSAARVALKSGDIDEARSMANAALTATSDSTVPSNSKLLRQLGELFFDLNQPAEAKQAALFASAAGPNDAENTSFLSKAFSKNGEVQEALQSAHLAAALAPERGEFRRQLAHALKAAGQGADAYAEWKAVLAQEIDPAIEDLFALADSALAADESSACIEACQRVLAAQATHAGAHALIGKALLAQGDSASAIEHLRRATELAPAQSEAWVVLAELQRAEGKLDQARDTLLTAQQFTTPSVNQLALLGEIYLGLNEKAAALNVLSRAAELAGSFNDIAIQQQIAFELGKLQRQLGYANQARHTLEHAHLSFPENVDIAHQYAKVLLDAGESKAALEALIVPLQTNANSDVLLDAARAHLMPGGDAAKAEAYLRTAMDSKTVSVEARALLAESLAAQGNHADAEKQFELALKTDLAQNAIWNKRLILGKALSVAASGKPAEAIASLEAMDKSNPGDLDTLRALCSAYSQAGRNEEAFQIASKVYLNAAKDEDTILWFAEQAETLGKAEDARKALSKGIKDTAGSPKQVQRLAELLWQDGAHEKAVDTLAILLNSGNTNALAKAGRFLMERDAAATSVPYFKRALDLGDSTDATLLDSLTKAYEYSEQWAEAISIVDKSIQAEPTQPGLLARKADLQYKSGRPQAALETLEKAIEQLPNDANLLAKKAYLLRSSQDWTGALSAAEKAFHSAPNAENLQLAAELALATLQPEHARAILAETKTSASNGSLACLEAELALDANEELHAAKSLGAVIDAEPDARVLGLQAQLAARRDDILQAEQYLNEALAIINSSAEKHHDLFAVNNVAKAAQKLNKWDVAVNLLQSSAKRNQGQPLAQFNLGKAIVQRAEWQQLCEAADCPNGAAGVVAISKESFAAAKAAFAAAQNTAPISAKPAIERWEARAEQRFSSKADLSAFPQGYPSTAGEAAALLFAAGKAGDLKPAEENTKPFSKSHEVLAERALAIGDVDATGALKLMLGAAEQKPTTAAYHALAAKFAQATGETQTALSQIEKALTLSPDQASWQATAGKLHSQTGDFAAAVKYFEKAIALEPKSAETYFELGQTQTAAQSFSEAIKSYESAANLQPKSIQYTLALAQAHKDAGETKQAKEKAIQAQKLSANSAAPFILQAEIALQENNPESAKSLAEQAIRLAPKDADALRLYGESLHALGQVDDAIAVFKRAEQHAADSVPLQIRKAQLSGEKGLEDLIKLSQQQADRPDVYLALSEMLAAHGFMDDAIQAAQRAAKKAAGALPRHEQARLHLHLGQLLKHNGQLDQSLHHLDEAAKLATHLPDSHIERGRVFLARRQFNEAMNAFTKAAEIAPASAQPHIEAALALKEAKDYGAAEHEFRKAAKLAPKDRTIARQLAAVIALNLIHQPQDANV